MAIDVPAPLRSLVEAWRAEGCPAQAPMDWPRGSWIQHFDHHRLALSLLPEGLDRDTVRTACENAGASPEAAEQAFLAVMAWGYGGVGYGPWRVARILSQNRRAAARLRDVAATLSTDGALAAYQRLANYQDCRLRFLGPAFGTKYLAFCPADERRPALILDRLVVRWLARSVGLRFDSRSWAADTYQRYLQQMYEWAGVLDLTPDNLECRVFSAEFSAAGKQ